jgi:hypothetical protein
MKNLCRSKYDLQIKYQEILADQNTKKSLRSKYEKSLRIDEPSILPLRSPSGDFARHRTDGTQRDNWSVC